MDGWEAIIDYLTETYQPSAILVYGSYADGSAGECSDFDALVIAERPRMHDASVIGDTALDVWVYPPETFRGSFDPEEFVQVFDGRILLDREGEAARLQQRVLDHLAARPGKTEEELRQETDWCEKMLRRSLREDAEGFYRWHWVLADSLEIYCDLKGLPYRGPKKALRQMAQTDPGAYRLYARALQAMDREALTEWVGFLRTLV